METYKNPRIKPWTITSVYLKNSKSIEATVDETLAILDGIPVTVTNTDESIYLKAAAGMIRLWIYNGRPSLGYGADGIGSYMYKLSCEIAIRIEGCLVDREEPEITWD